MTQQGTPRTLAMALVLGAMLSGAAASASAGRTDWIEVDYSSIVDHRQLSHSGEPVGALLRRLGGRGLPEPGQRRGDQLIHSLLDPVLEPYAFVLSDGLDALNPVPEAAFVEVGSLWLSGEVQPAWVELLRGRRYLVESDGQGRFRVCLPRATGDRASQASPGTDSRAAAEQAWREAWPILRHPLEAERRRLGAARRGGAGPPELDVEVHAYRHRPERTLFELGTGAHRVKIGDTRPAGRRPPLDLEGLQRFLETGLQLEGARLGIDGTLRLLGSQPGSPPALLGRRLELADFAVAYRAVFHGGLAEPYMSLDRGFSPQTSIVNYGGRLRDTALGLVSLLCDIRFKTFSLGLDIVRGTDLRPSLRRQIPEFRSHLERLAAHPQSEGFTGQQTRLWFYPDNVDLTLSPQGDVLVLRRVRMSAASERVSDETLTAAGGEDPPWTRATIEAINRDYDALAGFFPELSDLDQVVRLLSLFTWLREAEREGYVLPELDALLALELPSQPTPRTFQQLLAFIALPQPGAATAVETFDRVPIAEALDRLNPASGLLLPARRRVARAAAGLDPQDSQQAALLAEFAGSDLDRLDDGELDLLAYRAERLRMHSLVLSTLDPPERQGLAARQEGGEQLRVFSVGIGGLDLGMGQALARAAGRRLALGAGDSAVATGPPGGAGERPGPEGAHAPREEWRRDPPLLPETVLPAHGPAAGVDAGGPHRGQHRVFRGQDGAPPSRWLWTLYGADGPEPRSRKLFLDDARHGVRVERVEGLSRWSFRMELREGRVVATPVPWSKNAAGPAGLPETASLPQGLALVRVSPPEDRPTASGTDGPPVVGLRLDVSIDAERKSRSAQFPRSLLQRLVLGREADRTPGQPLQGLAPLPAWLGEVASAMFLLNAQQVTRPWEDGYVPVPGEEDPARLAGALEAWWTAERLSPRTVVGIDPRVSPVRWESAPKIRGPVSLLLPAGAFPGPLERLRADLSGAWGAGPVHDSLPEAVDTPLVVVITGEAPALVAARLARLSTQPALRGRLLAVWSLSGPVRQDLPAALLDGGLLAGLGLAQHSLIGLRHAAEQIGELSTDLERGVATPRRVEELPGPFVWYF